MTYDPFSYLPLVVEKLMLYLISARGLARIPNCRSLRHVRRSER